MKEIISKLPLILDILNFESYVITIYSAKIQLQARYNSSIIILLRKFDCNSEIDISGYIRCNCNLQGIPIEITLTE